MSSILKGLMRENGKRTVKSVADEIASYIGDHPSDSAIVDAIEHEAKTHGFDPADLFDAVYDHFRHQIDENLHKWFKEKWVRFGPDGKIRGDCARGSGSEGKPKCLPQSKAHNLGKKGRKYAANKKRREDPNPERHGKAKNVATKKKSNEDISHLDEKWSAKYKSSINCSHPKGFSQKAHCAGKKKHNESIEMEMTCEDCGMCQTHGDHARDTLDEACWKGYHKDGMKTMFGKKYPNCVKNTNEEQDVTEEKCPECGGPMYHESMINEKQDACYHKVKSRYKVWPSAYASGALVQCRKKGAANWGNKSESVMDEEQLDEKCWDGYKQVGMKNKGGKTVPNCVAKESSIMKGLMREDDFEFDYSAPNPKKKKSGKYGPETQQVEAFIRYIRRMTFDQWGDVAAARLQIEDQRVARAIGIALNAAKVNHTNRQVEAAHRDGIESTPGGARFIPALRVAALAAVEILGAAVMRGARTPFFFLPMFGFNSPDDIPNDLNEDDDFEFDYSEPEREKKSGKYGPKTQQVEAFFRYLETMTPGEWEASCAAARDSIWNNYTLFADRSWPAAVSIVGKNKTQAAFSAGTRIQGIAASQFRGDGHRGDGEQAGHAANEIQGAEALLKRGTPFFFLPMFGFANPDEIPDELNEADDFEFDYSAAGEPSNWRDDPMQWHGSQDDPDWYEGYINRPIKMVTDINQWRSAAKTIRDFTKTSPTTAEVDVGAGYGGPFPIDFDRQSAGADDPGEGDAHPFREFYCGEMPVTARQAFNLFQTKKHKKKRNRPVDEAGSPAQQAAIAINMKKHHKKPKHVDEDYTGIESGPSTGPFTAEKTPAINPYGGMKDKQYRGAIGEGISEGEVVPFRRKELTWKDIPGDVKSLLNDEFWAEMETRSYAGTTNKKYRKQLDDEIDEVISEMQNRGWRFHRDWDKNVIELTNTKGQTVTVPDTIEFFMDEFEDELTEMPDTSGPVGVQPGGWRTYRPKPAGTDMKKESSIMKGLMREDDIEFDYSDPDPVKLIPNEYKKHGTGGIIVFKGGTRVANFPDIKDAKRKYPARKGYTYKQGRPWAGNAYRQMIQRWQDENPHLFAPGEEELEEVSTTGQGGGSAGIGGGSMVGGPTTYEQEYGMFKKKGPRRITAMTNEVKNVSPKRSR